MKNVDRPSNIYLSKISCMKEVDDRKKCFIHWMKEGNVKVTTIYITPLT